MSCAELYNRVLAALHEDESSFNAAARNWIEGVEDAPFEDEEAKELFANAKHCCAVWRSGAINARISKRRMIECVRKIAEKNLGNPYKDIEAGFRALGVNPVEVKLEDEPEAIQGTTLPKEAVDAFAEAPLVNAVNAEEIEKAVKKTEHVLGVVPEEKPGLFKRKKR